MLFITKDCIGGEMLMYKNASNKYHDYSHSDLRKYLNTKFLHFFPEDIRNRMVPTINGDYLRIPTERQIFGKNIFGTEESYTKQFHGMKHWRNRMVFECTEEKEYWLQDYVSNNAFACVYHDGKASFSNADRFRCVRVVFELSSGEANEV